uniref:Uncharacterized protein n=1 Tax=uncultured marine virus TaxID=186617 RepID=A0A0F7L7Y4_9VIRU|nr:hypothetical protein [uncultured marine virus]
MPTNRPRVSPVNAPVAVNKPLGSPLDPTCTVTAEMDPASAKRVWTSTSAPPRRVAFAGSVKHATACVVAASIKSV